MRKVTVLLLIATILTFCLTGCSTSKNNGISELFSLVTSSECDMAEVIQIVDSKITSTKELNNGVRVEFEDGTIFKIINESNNEETYMQSELTFDSSWDDDKVLDYLYVVSDDYFYDTYKNRISTESLNKSKTKYEYSLINDDNKNTIIIKGSLK